MVGNIAQAVKALRGSLKFLYDYGDNGDFGILDSVTSSHASTLMRKTGTGEGGDKTIGGDLVVDVRNLNTRTIINDNAKLKAGSGAIKVNSSAKGTQVTIAGQLPIFLTLSNPLYISKDKAASGFGASIIVGEKTFNTATYIGAATLEAKQLNVDATGDVFMMEMSVGGTFGSKDKGGQGGLNIIAENKMTVSEISGNAQITLSGNGDAESSSITATDKSTLLNISGLQAAGGHTAVGFGVTITLNNAFTAAMLGNNTAISSAFQKNWESLKSTYNMPFAREGAITLNLQGSAKLDVLAENRGTLLNIGIAGAVQTSSEEGGTADAAANVGVTHTRSETTARQTGVTKIGSYNNNVTTKAKEHTNIISVAGDASINVAGKNVVTGAGALSVNRGVMDTTAYVTDCAYDKIGDFTVATDNTSKVVAVDVAAAVGAAKAGIAAGSAWNSLTGNTGSYLTGGRISATNLNVTSLTDLTSFSCTLGAAIGITINAGGQGAGELDRAPGDALDKARDLNDADKNDIFWRNDLLIGDKDIGDDGEGLTIGEDLPELLDDNGVSFDLGASIARNALTMSSTAKVEGCVVSTPGLLKVTAEDNSVITAIGIGAAFDHADGTTIGSGGVFSFAPVGSTAEAAIIGKGNKDVLDINAGSLTLQAKDNHRERVWSFGGGYGDTAGIGLVLSWGSFAGTITKALIEKVNATVADNVDIKATSNLDSTFISVGASASKGYAAVTGMVNYLNFNNQVITDIKNSTLTVTNVNGKFDALSQSKRTFTDGVGDIGIRVGGKGGGAAVGAALSFVYVGGNGAGDTNLTEMMVNNSVINNSGTTKLLAKSTTTGILAGANTGIAAVSSGLFGLAASGSFSWLSDASFTQVDIKDTFFNQRKSAVAADKNADITAEATSSSNLTFGFGTLNVQIGQLDKPGGAVGASVGVLKDNATTAATMVGGGVGNAHDFTLHASGRSDMDSLIVGASGSALAGVSGGALAATISHRVGAYMEESVMNMNGALTIKADNLSNVGKGGKTRFTIANGALGVSGAGAGVGVSFIDIVDKVSAKAHNASVKSGSMEVLAQEESNADAVTVNVAGAQYIGMNATVARPVLRGEATACITANKQKIANGTADVGIVTTRTTDQKGRVITTGDLKVNAKNTQWMRSHLWSFVLGVNPKLPSVDVCVTSNSINMVGSANAWIEGPLTLSVGGDLTVEALTDRTATYTTVPVVAAISLYGFALNVDVNSMRVSSDTGTYTVEESSVKKDAAKQIDREIEAIYQLLKKGGIKPDGKKDLVSTLR